MKTKLLVLVAVLSLVGAGVAYAASLTVTTQLLTGFRTCTLSGLSTGTSVADAFVDENAPTSTNNTATLSVLSNNAKSRRVFIRFDLSKCSPAIATTSTVALAQLRLYVSTASASARTYEVRAASASWTEAVTWNTQPAVSATPTASNSCCTTANVYVSWTVTSDVSTFVATPASNNGWRIGDSSEVGNNGGANFRSRENNTGSGGGAHWDQAPQLVITYSP